jgi:peptidoglycan hydrolase-like protein with peptidoglycan-binding domain
LSFLPHLRVRVAAIGGVIVLLLVAGVWVALAHGSDPASGSTRTSGSTSSGRTASKASSKGSSQVPSGPLQLLSETPASNASGVSGVTDVKVQFSAPLAASSPLPRLKPRVAGSWQGTGTSTLTFVPSRGFSQQTRVRVTIPGGTAGVRSAHGALLAKTIKVNFRTGSYQTARLDELLAQLGYLPFTWTASSGATVPPASDKAGQLAAAYNPPQGTFSWDSGYPSELHKFWLGGSADSLMVKGAVMAFEADQGLAVDGVPGPEVWSTLLKAVADNQVNTHGYTYALAREGNPETLTVWHDGKVIMKSLANTGIAAAPTTLGTAPVYIRYYYQVMKGTNPDGSKYADPVYYVSYFRAGEAVHYFPRGSYGFPQSLGCVELPWSSAKFIWKYMNYGTLVTVARGSQTPSTSPSA